MDLKTAKYNIIAPTLRRIGLYSPAALNLVAGIGMVESGYRTRKQIGGPALGYWQMEPATEQDCWVNFLDYRPLLAGLVRKIAAPSIPQSYLLLTSDPYAAAMCRIRLYRSPDPLPDATNAEALCRAWRIIYNTVEGAGQVDAAHIALFQQAIDA